MNSTLAAAAGTIVRVPIPAYFEGIHPCIFASLLPDPKGCPEPGYYGELGTALVRMIYPAAKVRHFPTAGLAGHNGSYAALRDGQGDLLSFTASAHPDLIGQIGYTQFCPFPPRPRLSHLAPSPGSCGGAVSLS